ncbi:hypothetical protein NP493_217g01020 [Ridgeia piscesae]|uniref:PRKR-interacting protein 1 n=1 Tax=Ridgeia piscesae TaxID=27915 RepID=A0AAD9P0P9_RIDPI|nr:hypothetical protein NP493_217g01020 [Ridgeia piscesae]
MAEETQPDKEEKVVVVAKRPADVQRIKLEKLMKNPSKPVFIPEKREGKLPKVFNPPEFVRNIWGSSAGAGSGDFHVYRSVRRREYARQKFINEMAEQEKLDEEYHVKMKEHEKAAELRTAKKRNKRRVDRSSGTCPIKQRQKCLGGINYI